MQIDCKAITQEFITRYDVINRIKANMPKTSVLVKNPLLDDVIMQFLNGVPLKNISSYLQEQGYTISERMIFFAFKGSNEIVTLFQSMRIMEEIDQIVEFDPLDEISYLIQMQKHRIEMMVNTERFNFETALANGMEPVFDRHIKGEMDVMTNMIRSHNRLKKESEKSLAGSGSHLKPIIVNPSELSENRLEAVKDMILDGKLLSANSQSDG